MNALNALGHYINYCNQEGKTSARDNEGMHKILEMPNSAFIRCTNGYEVYQLVQGELRKKYERV